MNETRIVTGHSHDGRSEILIRGPLPGGGEFAHHPGFAAGLVWQTAAQPRIAARAADAVAEVETVIPQPGATVAMKVTFPPDSVTTSERFDPAAAGAEFARRLPGLGETFDADGSGFHRTDSIDYGVVLDGEIWLELDDGEATCLRKGDVVVQMGTRHAWRNKGDKPAQLFFVLIGAGR